MARDHRAIVEGALRAQEGRQHADARSSAGARSIRSTCASAASTARRRGPSWRPRSPSAGGGARVRPRGGRVDRGAAVPRLRGGLPLRRAARTPTATRSSPAGSSPAAGSTSRRTSTRRTSPRSTSRTRPRCTRGCASGERYLVGPLARYALNRDQLSPAAREAADAAGLGAGLPQPVPQHHRARRRDPVRASTRRCGCSTAYEPPRAAGDRGAAARRHRLRLVGGAARAALAPLRDRRRAARSSTPRSSRRRRRTRPGSSRACAASSSATLALADDELQHRCEQAVRSYDPCISCATHFLKLEIDRG